MFYNEKNKQYIRENTSFTLDGIQYPAQWLNQATEAQKKAIGLEEVIVTNNRLDDRFYWVSEELNGSSLTYINTPKDLENLKTLSIEQIKQTSNSLLSQTDWYVIRKAERNIAIPSDIADKRSAIITESNRLENDINAATNVEALIAVLNTQNFEQDKTISPSVSI